MPDHELAKAEDGITSASDPKVFRGVSQWSWIIRSGVAFLVVLIMWRGSVGNWLFALALIALVVIDYLHPRVRRVGIGSDTIRYRGWLGTRALRREEVGVVCWRPEDFTVWPVKGKSLCVWLGRFERSPELADAIKAWCPEGMLRDDSASFRFRRELEDSHNYALVAVAVALVFAASAPSAIALNGWLLGAATGLAVLLRPRLYATDGFRGTVFRFSLGALLVAISFYCLQDSKTMQALAFCSGLVAAEMSVLAFARSWLLRVTEAMGTGVSAQ
jgi:hypothetical protein